MVQAAERDRETAERAKVADAAAAAAAARLEEAREQAAAERARAAAELEAERREIAALCMQVPHSFSSFVFPAFVSLPPPYPQSPYCLSSSQLLHTCVFAVLADAA